MDTSVPMGHFSGEAGFDLHHDDAHRSEDELRVSHWDTFQPRAHHLRQPIARTRTEMASRWIRVSQGDTFLVSRDSTYITTTRTAQRLNPECPIGTLCWLTENRSKNS